MQLQLRFALTCGVCWTPKAMGCNCHSVQNLKYATIEWTDSKNNGHTNTCDTWLSMGVSELHLKRSPLRRMHVPLN